MSSAFVAMFIFLSRRVRWVLTVLTLSDSMSATCDDGLAGRQQLEHLELAVGQALVRRPLALAGEERGERLGELRADVPAPRGDLADRVDQLVGRRLLREKAGGTGLERANRVLVLGVHREDQHRELRPLAPDPREELEPLLPGSLRSRRTTVHVSP